MMEEEEDGCRGCKLGSHSELGVDSQLTGYFYMQVSIASRADTVQEFYEPRGSRFFAPWKKNRESVLTVLFLPVQKPPVIL